MKQILLAMCLALVLLVILEVWGEAGTLEKVLPVIFAQTQTTQDGMIARLSKRISGIAWIDQTTLLATVFRVLHVNDIALVRLPTGELTTLASGQCASASPDRSKVAWIPGPKTLGDVWVLDLRSQARRRLTEGLSARCLTWSPDGRRIALTNFSPRPGTIQVGGNDILIVSAQDGHVEFSIDRGNHSLGDPSWHPDSQSLAFHVLSSVLNVNRIDIFNLRVRKRSALVTIQGADWARDLAFSPDGRNLLFVVGRVIDGGQIFAFDGSSVRSITRGHAPLWYPDGNSILFAREYGCTPCEGDELRELRF